MQSQAQLTLCLILGIGGMPSLNGVLQWLKILSIYCATGHFVYLSLRVWLPKKHPTGGNGAGYGVTWLAKTEPHMFRPRLEPGSQVMYPGPELKGPARAKREEANRPRPLQKRVMIQWYLWAIGHGVGMQLALKAKLTGTCGLEAQKALGAAFFSLINQEHQSVTEEGRWGVLERQQGLGLRGTSGARQSALEQGPCYMLDQVACFRLYY